MKTTLQKGLELLCGLFDVFPFLYNFKRLWNTFKEVVLRSGYYHGITLRCLTCFVYTLSHYLIFLHAFFFNLQCVAQRKRLTEGHYHVISGWPMDKYALQHMYVGTEIANN